MKSYVNCWNCQLSYSDSNVVEVSTNFRRAYKISVIRPKIQLPSRYQCNRCSSLLHAMLQNWHPRQIFNVDDEDCVQVIRVSIQNWMFVHSKRCILLKHSMSSLKLGSYENSSISTSLEWCYLRLKIILDT